MGIKRTVLTITIDPRILSSVTKKNFFQKLQKTEICIFPLYFWVKSFKKCLYDWGIKIFMNLTQNWHTTNTGTFKHFKRYIFWTTLMAWSSFCVTCQIIIWLKESIQKTSWAELGQAQLNWKLGFAEAEVGADFGNKSSSFCWYEVSSSSWSTWIY